MVYYLVKLYSNNYCLNRFISEVIPGPKDLNKFIFDRINIKIISGLYLLF